MILRVLGTCLWGVVLSLYSWAEPVAELEFSAVRVDGSVRDDEGLAAYLAPYREGVEAFAAEVIGYAAEPLSRSRPECGLSNLVADSLRVVGAKEFGAEVDLSVTNFGGLRRDLPQGELTMGLITELSPFENYLTYLEVDGAFVQELARQAAGGVAVSGIKVTLDSEGRVLEALVNGEPIDARRRYRVVTIDYLVATYGALFREEWILEKRVSKNLIQRDAIVLHLSALAERGVRIFDAGEGRVRVVE
ncbi:5'-nucleotidase C-terminal domain-containing protein [Pelagicoccus sp. NFK12]|uniref:5'-nucleotidase C-terminal domain-containing protein n=1 Tax=Pelagicoccus enzymogenes TaxID=2773457 RepID=A0A927IIP9_9BACT|nr:5'-nucleotidase [Pelagicoccus enzymogenes]MBD5781486.1 5'-nucleotidase C-terminal domain-containing protein [Pelagicoccus enzymogenes]MDQ8199085.1 5'-nucleotidase [Pelagicoccus enzymogenes]